MLREQFTFPGFGSYRHDLVEFFGREALQSIPRQVLVPRHPPERAFDAIVKPLQIKPYPTPRAIANSYEIALAEYPGGEGLNPLALWDIHWVKQADDSGFIEDLIARMA